MNEKNNYQNETAKTWDEINECLVSKTTAISHEAFLNAQAGELKVSLAGANVTVTDLSDQQLANEKYVSAREGYSINIIKADLSKQFPFEDNSFDIIFNPVSNCYIEHLQPVWNECSRVIRKNGILMMAFVKEEFFLFEPDYKNEDFLISRHTLPFNPYKDLSEESKKRFIEEHRPFAFSHSLTEQIGGLIKAGFEITDIYEDSDGGGLFDKYMNSYVAVRAVRK